MFDRRAFLLGTSGVGVMLGMVAPICAQIALLLSPNTTNFLKRRELADFARQHRLPSIGAQRELAEAGVMMVYGVSFDDLLRTTARFVDKILRGAKPADLPIEQPTTFDLVLNATTARALGITFPPALRARAEVIE